METKRAKIMVLKAGGTASENALKYRVAIPNQWVAALDISKESPEVELLLDGDKIILKKISETDMTRFQKQAIQKGNLLKEYCYYHGKTLCTKILADFTAQRVCAENQTDDLVRTAFGANTAPSWVDFLTFLEERCLPRTRKGIATILEQMNLATYDPIAIVEHTEGRMAEDDQWLRIREV